MNIQIANYEISTSFVSFILVSSILFLLMNNIGYKYVLKLIVGKNCVDKIKNTSIRYSDDKLPLVSIIIPTFNEEKNITKKIQNILEYEYPKNNLEVIIVDDGSVDKTKDVINNLIINNDHLLNIKLISIDNQGPGNALKIGSNDASGDLILWTDADAYHPKTNLIRGINHLRDEKVGAVCGTTKPTFDTKDTTVRASELAIRDELRLYESCIDSILYTNATFLLFNNKFKNLISTNINYDATLAIGIRKKGFKVRFDPNIISYHIEPTKIITHLKRKKRIFLGLLELVSQNIGVNFNPKYGKFGMIIAPRNMLFYVLEPAVFVCFLIALLILVGLNIIYMSLIACFIVYILKRTRFNNISSTMLQQMIGYLINFIAYFEFAVKKMVNVKIKYIPGKE